jgi:hypothetical protein
MAPRAFRHVISLGTHCYASHLLQRLGLRHAAGPFDWIFSDPRMNAECLADRFRGFLDRDQYVPVDTPQGLRFGHKDLSPRFSRKVIFNHHDPRTDQDYDRFQRSVARLETILDSHEPALFLCVTSPDRAQPTALAALDAALQARTYNAHLIVVIAEVTKQPAEHPVLQSRLSSETLEVFQLTSTGPMQGGLTFENPADEQTIVDLMDRFDLAPARAAG